MLKIVKIMEVSVEKKLDILNGVKEVIEYRLECGQSFFEYGGAHGICSLLRKEIEDTENTEEEVQILFDIMLMEFDKLYYDMFPDEKEDILLNEIDYRDHPTTGGSFYRTFGVGLKTESYLDWFTDTMEGDHPKNWYQPRLDFINRWINELQNLK
jgi:hypothetical protein